MNTTPSIPKLAYLGSGIPALSATFIYREIFELDRRGYPVAIYSIHSPDRRTLSAEALPLCDRTHYLLPVRIPLLLSSHFTTAMEAPRRYFGALFKMLTPRHESMRHRFRSLMHFGEGVVLARRMQADGVTHIHAHYASQPTSVARVVHLLTGIPYSFSAHAHDIWSDRLLLRQKLHEARFVACCSAHGRNELVRQGDPADSGKVTTVYHGIDVRRFIPPNNGIRSNDLILAVGRLDAMKGFHNLIAACHALKRSGIPFKCRIVGEGPERDHLSRLIARHGLDDEVTLAGAIPQEKLLSHYHEAALFVLPSVITATHRYDGIPNVLVEAMATGLPVISTPISGIPELINPGITGFLVQPDQPDDLACSIARLLTDDSLRHRVGMAAREQTSARWDNRKTSEPLIALFREAGALPIRTPEAL